MRFRLPVRWATIKLFFTLVVLSYMPFLLYDLYTKEIEMKFYMLHMENVSMNGSDSQCIIPDFDPYDPSVVKYFQTVSPVRCGLNQPYLTYLDQEGYIHLNKTAVKESGLQEKDYDCSYSEILRPDGNDGEVTFGQPEVFRQSEKVGESGFILVRCYLRATREMTYENLHFYVPLPSGERYANTKRPRDGDVDHPNVLIVTIDSMSRLNFMRQLPKTYSVLTKDINATVFKGMTKTGDNTFPNMIPLLTGRRLERPKYFDDFPFVWKNFSAKGYVTLFNEDFPYLSLFNYLASGFRRPPTDYYLHPFWLAVEVKDNFESWDWRCSGNTPKHVLFLDYIKLFVARMKEHRYFAFNFITGLSHEDLNLIQVGDSDFAAAFFKIWSEGYLDNTVLIVMGDHGNRFSGLRQTHIGRVESNMPFFAVRLPETFKRRFPHLDAELQNNANKLLSWFDFYEMLMDIANNNLGKTPLVPRYGEIGSSPFRRISDKRTCEDAGIPEEYCICARETQLSTNDTRVTKIAQDLVSHINNVLLATSIKQGLCSHLKLTNILSAQKLSLGAQVAKPRGFRVLFRVTVQVSPSNGVFEGTLELDAWSSEGRVVGDVNRLNLYGKQSECVNDTVLRLYCFCRDNLHL